MTGCLLLAALAVATCATASASVPAYHQGQLQHHDNHPDISAAQHNAFALFNSIHSAMRQWGSSVHHNGMSFFLARAPEGSVFYHGGHTATRPTSFEWLAFEVEHAANFAHSWEGRPRPNPSKTNTESSTVINLDVMLFWHRFSRFQLLRETPETPNLVDLSEPAQQRLSSRSQERGDSEGNGTMPGGPPDPGGIFRGYFQTYRANRPLNLLYIDGEGAAKCTLGSMDSQDLILLGWNYTEDTTRKQMMNEFRRARELCAVADEWAFAVGGKIDGFIRMEAGFEIIYCDFSPTGGLDLTTVQASPFKNESLVDEGPMSLPFSSVHDFEWLRACAARFQGHPAGRLDVDWSSMVTAFSYPVNLSNPDVARQDLPRLLNATEEGRNKIRSRLRDVVTERGGGQASNRPIVNWQGTIDRIVTRYSKRLELLSGQNLTANELLTVMSTLLDPFTDYLDHSSMAERSATRRCAQHYLQSLSLYSKEWTPEDHAIFAAVETVSSTICSSLFTSRRLLINSMSMTDSESVVEQARKVVRELSNELRWSTWKECGSCATNEICSIPMFPVGTTEDYFHPTCKKITQMDAGYFGPFT